MTNNAHDLLNKLAAHIRAHRALYGAMGLLQLYLWPWVFVPFIFHDQLQLWDTAGHLFAAQFLRENLFPNFTGWNPYFYAGFPQDTLYPPLYHYAIAALSYALGYAGALKTIHIASVLALMPAFYYFVRGLQFEKTKAAIASFVMMFPIIGYAIHTGGTLHSLFFVGLGSNSLALPLLFFYAGILLRNRFDRRGLIGATLLLTAIILTHYVATIAAGIILLLWLLYHFTAKRLVFTLTHGAVATVIAGCWLIPFIRYLPYYGGAFVVVDIAYFITIPVFIAMALSIGYLLKKNDSRYGFPLLLIFAFSVLIFVDFYQYKIPIHPYRFIIYLLLLAFMCMAILLDIKRMPHNVRYLSWITISALVAQIISVSGLPNTYIPPNQNALYKHYPINVSYTVNTSTLPKLDGRMIAYDGDVQPHIHDLRTEVVRTTKNFLIKGLFIESSSNGKYLASIHMNAVRGGFVWGAPIIPFSTDGVLTTDPAVLKKAFDLFNINHLLTSVEVPNAVGQRIPVVTDRSPYYLYRVGSSTLVEAISQPPRPITENWTTEVINWLQSPTGRPLVWADTLPEFAPAPSTTITMLEESPLQDYVKFSIDSQTPVPVLVKISYFPRWKAYVDGQPAHIYRTSPYLMLIYGKGVVELRYEPSAWDYIGWTSTIAGCVLLYVLGRRLKTASTLDPQDTSA